MLKKVLKLIILKKAEKVKKNKEKIKKISKNYFKIV
jgi:hypothetical protein